MRSPLRAWPCVLLVSLLLACGGENSVAPEQTGSQTRLYLLDSTLSTLPSTESGVTQRFVYESAEWTATLAGDMVGTRCTFGILFAAPPGRTVDAHVEVIVRSGTTSTAIAGKTFTVASSTYARFLESVNVPDPQCAEGDELTLRISKSPPGSPGLGVMVDNRAPNDSYVEVPRVSVAE